ncbi:hypothetical protein F4141_25345 [Candidatus Poribacteria bacterium]|nr:hypothetical protein [Candidatus Poribacteria bacterium]MYH84023.1 hypothetical protein [Candidatus Poribacteria bacterium]
MSKYESGITDINVLVRRLGYVSAILRLLEHNTLSESMLYSRLEKWSLDHKQDFATYPNPQGFINATREQTGPKRYTNLAVSLGLVGRIAGACRVTRFGKTLLPFLDQGPDRNPFELIYAEQCAYLYWLLVKDSDQFLTVIRILAEESPQSLSDLQSFFPECYRQQLQAHMLTAEKHIARDILAVRNRVEHWGKVPKRTLENIVPPRVHWLIDLGLVSTEDSKGKPPQLTTTGIRFYKNLPKIREGIPAVHRNAWLRNSFFGVVGQIFTDEPARMWSKIKPEKKKELLNKLAFGALETLRSTPIPKISLYPALIYMVLLLTVDNGIAANLEELRADLDIFSKDSDTQYAVRFSHRENESYLIFFPT